MFRIIKLFISGLTIIALFIFRPRSIAFYIPQTSGWDLYIYCLRKILLFDGVCMPCTIDDFDLQTNLQVVVSFSMTVKSSVGVKQTVYFLVSKALSARPLSATL